MPEVTFYSEGVGKRCGSPKVAGSGPFHCVTSVAIRFVTMTTRVDNYSAMQETVKQTRTTF